MERKKVLAWMLALAVIFTNISWPTGIFAAVTAEADDGTEVTLESPEFDAYYVSDDEGGLEVIWDKVDGAEGYIICVQHTDWNNWTEEFAIEDAETTSTVVSCTRSEGELCYVWVVAYAGDTTSSASQKKSIYYYYPKMYSQEDGMSVKWSKVSGSNSYEIYRKTTGAYTLVGTATDNSWLDTSAEAGTKYTYQIVAICDDETYYSMERSATYLTTPVIISMENTSDGVCVTWETVAGAEKYLVYTSSSSYYTVTAESGEQQSYTMSRCTSGTEYTIYIYAVSESDIYATLELDWSPKSETVTYMYLSCPKVTVTTDESSISLSGDEVTGAEGYKIYRKTGDGSYSLVETTVDTSWTDTDISASTLYTYQVYAYSGDYISAGSEEQTGGTKAISVCELTLSESSYTYDGTEQTPAVTVYDGTKLLTLDTDYSVSYSGSDTAGTATVTITGIGNYTGTATTTYTIAKADQAMTASLEDSEMKAGTARKITVNDSHGTLNFSSSDTSVASVSSSGTVTAVGAGTATITITAAGDENYNSATTTVSVTVTETSLTGDTSTSSGTDTSISTGTDTSTDTSTETSSGTDTSTDTNTDSSSSTGTSNGTSTGTDTSTDTSTSTETDTNTNSSSDISTGTSTEDDASASLDYTLGDINEDGYVSYLDAMTALRYDAELIDLSDSQLLAGDVNGDGSVDSLDAILILRFDAGLIESF